MDKGCLQVKVKGVLGEADTERMGNERILYRWWAPGKIRVTVTEFMRPGGPVEHACLVVHWSMPCGALVMLTAMDHEAAGLAMALREMGASGLLPDVGQDCMLELVAALDEAAQEVA